MAGFRDDREALLARLDALQGELARAGGAADREALRRRVEELAAAVDEATDRLDRDRGALGELGARLDAVRRELGGSSVPARSVASAPPAVAPAPPRGARFPLWLAVIPVAAIAIASALVRGGSSPDEAAVPLDPTQSAVPGDPRAFDPLAALDRARQRSLLGAGGQLSGIRAQYVSPNGRLDLEARAYHAQVVYTFYEPGPTPPPEADTPLGVPRPVSMGQYATVEVTSAGMTAFPPTPFPSGGAAPEPRCSFASLWAVARARGAPEGAVATIDYGGTAAEGHWNFSIADTSTNFAVTDDECLAEARSAGAPPPGS